MKSVLLIDDEPDVRESIQVILTAAGYAVRAAATGKDGLDEFRREPADLVITDMIMPSVHGLDIIKTLKSESPDTRILAISGGGNFGPLAYRSGAISTSAYLAAATAAGAVHALTKPFDRAGLLEAVRIAMEAPAPGP